jgi:hypothetical protein
MAINIRVTDIFERQSRNTYKCECQQESCTKWIPTQTIYTLFKMVECIEVNGEKNYKNFERKISNHCEFLGKWKVFTK